MLCVIRFFSRLLDLTHLFLMFKTYPLWYDLLLYLTHISLRVYERGLWDGFESGRPLLEIPLSG